MGIRFSKRIKFGDLLKLNISKSGVSATIGKKGASINVGTKGTYLNLSPTIAGISGTGVSYRKKISGGYSNLLNGLTTNKNENANNKIDEKIIEEYENNLNESINIHKLSDKVLNASEFDNKINNEKNNDIKDLYINSKDEDEEAIEYLVGAFFTNFDFVYPVKANYEYEDASLYIDLDLPEIEDFSNKYPEIVKNKLINKNKTKTQLKQEYAYTVMSLSIYIACQLFNVSPAIKNIYISGFTSVRKSNGELVDEYIYSINYLRDVFENNDITKIDDTIKFINSFENRILLNNDNFSFKAIKPFEMPSVERNNDYINDAISGLKELGYKNSIINTILPKLNSLKFDNSSDYLKEALKLINKL